MLVSLVPVPTRGQACLLTVSIISGLLTSEYARSELVDVNGAPDPGSGHDTRVALDVLLTGATFAIPAVVMALQVRSLPPVFRVCILVLGLGPGRGQWAGLGTGRGQWAVDVGIGRGHWAWAVGVGNGQWRWAMGVGITGRGHYWAWALGVVLCVGTVRTVCSLFSMSPPPPPSRRLQLAKSSHKHANIVATKARSSLLQARASFQQARLSVTGLRSGSISNGTAGAPGAPAAPARPCTMVAVVEGQAT